MRKKWTTEEDDFVRAKYLTNSCKQMADVLGRTKAALNNRLRIMKLVRTEESRRRLKEISWFVKGQESYNKGRKGIHLSPATEFKKGITPANKRPIWTISVRGNYKKGMFYKYVKVGSGEHDWELLQRHIWEKHHGKLEKGQIIRFADGNQMNCDPENLTLETRQTHLDKNRNYEKTAASMREVWRQEKHYDSDTWIAFTIFPRDKEMRLEALKHPSLIVAQRLRLKMARKLKRAA